MRITFLQTADPNRYRKMLALTSRTVEAYCARHDFIYESFVGICRGLEPWHATYNRIILLRRFLAGGYDGWVCYLDADAYIVDLRFDLSSYLNDKPDVAFIAETVSSSAPWWQVNAGVFFINLSHPVAHEIITRWVSLFEAISDKQLKSALAWGQIRDDQSMLQECLRDTPKAELSTLVEYGFLNYSSGSFIKQILRASGNVDDRVKIAQEDVDRVLGSSAGNQVLDGKTHKAVVETIQEEFARALYRTILLREPDPPGLANAVGALRRGKSLEDALRSCFKSDEFAIKHRQFASVYLRQKSIKDNLTSLANAYGAYKGTIKGAPPHKYTYLYDFILYMYRHEKINFLELGLAVGGHEVGGSIDQQVAPPSVQMWLQYFEKAHIFGFDASDFSHIKHPRFTFVRGDGRSIEDISKLSDSAPGFDVILDDGSHTSYGQQLAFNYLFPKLRPGGIYMLEDPQWQSSLYEGKPIILPKTHDFFISYFERGDYIQNDLLSDKFMETVRKSVASYAWFPDFSGQDSGAKLFLLRKSD